MEGSSVFGRMVRASKLEVALYEEVEADPTTTKQAFLAVVLVSLISGIGTGISGMMVGGGLWLLWGLLAGIATSLVGWLAWSFFTWLLGTTVFKCPETSATWGELLRTIGFAYSPGVLRFFAFIPFLGGILAFAGLVWSLIAGIVAVRQALDFSTGRAIATCIVGWLIYMAIVAVVGILLGGARAFF